MDSVEPPEARHESGPRHPGQEPRHLPGAGWDVREVPVGHREDSPGIWRRRCPVEASYRYLPGAGWDAREYRGSAIVGSGGKHMRDVKVSKIELRGVSRKEKRSVKATLTNGTGITIVPCYESWEQYGGTRDELYITVPVAERYNAWLHGEG